jgi:hypothetical protein
MPGRQPKRAVPCDSTCACSGWTVLRAAPAASEEEYGARDGPALRSALHTTEFVSLRIWKRTTALHSLHCSAKEEERGETDAC